MTLAADIVTELNTNWTGGVTKPTLIALGSTGRSGQTHAILVKEKPGQRLAAQIGVQTHKHTIRKSTILLYTPDATTRDTSVTEIHTRIETKSVTGGVWVIDDENIPDAPAGQHPVCTFEVKEEIY